jgi:hypothetical protein
MPTTVTAKPGERLHNTHFEDRFTCPNCLNDHDLRVPKDKSTFVDCECGARLRCMVDWVPEAVCIIADADETEDDELDDYDD